MRNLTVDLLKHLFEYDKETGELRWAVKRQGCSQGSVAGSIDSKGYRVITVNQKPYKAHRLVYLMHKGYLPRTLDHINNNRSDNRIENLRAVSAGQNQHNRKINSNNKSGYKGVSWYASYSKWKAKIDLENKTVFLGYYNTPEEADVVVRAAREELHGIYANHGDQ
tara:strand:- start:24 stop:521 length:498 start_codon:yes stop_codon:yes gene_type:complete